MMERRDVVPKVTCIMPIHNSARYLMTTLNSILDQSFSDFELICVDDASEDESLKILQSFLEKDLRIKVLTNEKRLGAAESRNRAVKYAVGEYVIFLDSDDWFCRDMLFRAYHAAMSLKLDVVIFGYNIKHMAIDSFGHERCDKAITIRFPFGNYTKDEMNVEILKSINFEPWNKLISRELIIQNKIFFQDIPSANDIYFVMSAILYAKNIGFIDEPLMTYYQGRYSSITMTRRSKKDYAVVAMGALYRHLLENESKVKIKANMYLECILDWLIYHFASTDISEEVKKNTYDLLCSDRILYDAIMDENIVKNLSGHNQEFVKDFVKQENLFCENLFRWHLAGIKELLRDSYNKKLATSLWGCGKLGKQLIDVLEDAGMKVDYVIDENKSKQGQTYKSYTISNYDDIKQNVDIIILPNSRFKSEVMQRTEGKKTLVLLAEL